MLKAQLSRHRRCRAVEELQRVITPAADSLSQKKSVILPLDNAHKEKKNTFTLHFHLQLFKHREYTSTSGYTLQCHRAGSPVLWKFSLTPCCLFPKHCILAGNCREIDRNTEIKLLLMSGTSNRISFTKWDTSGVHFLKGLLLKMIREASQKENKRGYSLVISSLSDGFNSKLAVTDGS